MHVYLRHAVFGRLSVPFICLTHVAVRHCHVIYCYPCLIVLIGALVLVVPWVIVGALMLNMCSLSRSEHDSFLACPFIRGPKRLNKYRLIKPYRKFSNDCNNLCVHLIVSVARMPSLNAPSTRPMHAMLIILTFRLQLTSVLKCSITSPATNNRLLMHTTNQLQDIATDLPLTPEVAARTSHTTPSFFICQHHH